MWSRGITVVALCVTCAIGVLAWLPAPAPGTPWSGGGDQTGLMSALDQAPDAVAAWKAAHARPARTAAPHGKPGNPLGTGWVKSLPGAFGKK